MPHTTTWEKDGIWWQFHGTVDAKEFIEADAELYNDPRFDRIKYWIWDGTHIEELAIDEVHAELIAATDWAATEYNKEIKGAMIAKDKNIQKRIKRYLEVSMEFESTWQLRVFENLEEARQWVSS